MIVIFLGISLGYKKSPPAFAEGLGTYRLNITGARFRYSKDYCSNTS